MLTYTAGGGAGAGADWQRELIVDVAASEQSSAPGERTILFSERLISPDLSGHKGTFVLRCAFLLASPASVITT